MGITKKRKAVAGKVDNKKIYSLAEATGLVKEKIARNLIVQ